jgi:probable O-glycosylation ligase (exosortase A-associated)
MRDLLVASIVFGSLPFIIKRPFWGVLLLAGLGYMNPHRLCYGFMLSMPAVQIVAIATLIGMLVSKEAKRMVWSREIVLLVVFVAWMGLATSMAFYIDGALIEYVRFIKIQILTLMTLLLLTSPQRVTLLIWSIVLSLGFYGVKGGVFTILKGGIHRVAGPGNTFIGGNNELALAMVMTIPLMRYLYQHETHRLIKLGLFAMMLLTAIAAIGTQSRGALVALTITGAVFWWKGKNKFFSGVVIAAVAFFILSFMPESWFARMDTIKTYEQDDSALGRINAWWVAYNVANVRLFGGGAGMWRPEIFQLFAPEPNRVHDVHSIYFEVLGEQGWPGLVLWLCLMSLTWLKCSSIIRIAKKYPQTYWARDLVAMIQVSLVGYFSAGAFLGLAYFDYVYHLIAVVVVTHVLVKLAGAEGSTGLVPKVDARSLIRTLLEQPRLGTQGVGVRPPATGGMGWTGANGTGSARPGP